MIREESIKWEKEIDALRKGEEIEYYSDCREKWEVIDCPTFCLCGKYRVKPAKKIDVASERVIKEIVKIMHGGDTVDGTFVREILSDVYGNE